MLQIQDLIYRVAGRILFDGASLSLGAGQHAGLVGPNGCGKTTLLGMIEGSIQADGGAIEKPRRWQVAAVAQEAPSGETSLIDAVLSADRERAALLAEADGATDPHRISEIHLRLADIEAHTAPARAAAILAGLGFDDQTQGRPCGELSGGMRMRVALAAALFRRAELLLLDEPTNHLDLEATLWLETYLNAYPGTIILVSHDRDLLNRVVDTIVHVDARRLVAYSGGYDAFERTRSLRLSAAAAAQTRQDTQRRHMQAFVDRFRYKASKARQAQSRLKALAKMEPIAAAAEEMTIALTFPDADPPAPPLLTLDRAAAGYNGVPVLRRIDLRIDPDDRIALLGANGNGKSTLAKVLAGRMEPISGSQTRSQKLRVGYFAQHQAEELSLDLTALEQARHTMPKATEEQVRKHLGRFGFPQKRAETLIGAMSGGEKARLLLALMSCETPNMLILDEPTNHLDVDSRQALVQAINGFRGAVILITHDPHLIALTADRLWLVGDGVCTPFDGDLDDYRRLLLDQRRTAGTRAGGSRSRDEGPNQRDRRRALAAQRSAEAPLRNKAKKIERTIEQLQKRKSALESQLADPAVYAKPPEHLTEINKRLHRLVTDLESAEEAWLEVHSALEEAASAS